MEDQEEEAGSNGEEEEKCGGEEENGAEESAAGAGAGAVVVASIEMETGGIFGRRNSVDLVLGELDDVGARRRVFGRWRDRIAGVDRMIRSSIRLKRARVSGMNTFGHGRK